jgi:rsbT co-antagonist protein RsbR
MIPQSHAVHLGQLVRDHQAALCAAWLERAGVPSVPAHCERFLQAFAAAVDDPQAGNIEGRAWRGMRDTLDDITGARAGRGSTAASTVAFVFAVKQPLADLLRTHDATAPAALRTIDACVDQLGMYALDGFQRSREQIIARQQRELLELSTPVISLWEGVPTVDTMVAQHLMKTIAAARLMGADCILSGIRPQIAQTIVHLGVDLAGVVTKATLADAFRHASGTAAG